MWKLKGPLEVFGLQRFPDKTGADSYRLCLQRDYNEAVYRGFWIRQVIMLGCTRDCNSLV